jgi:hypothetical protein
VEDRITVHAGGRLLGSLCGLADIARGPGVCGLDLESLGGIGGEGVGEVL